MIPASICDVSKGQTSYSQISLCLTISRTNVQSSAEVGKGLWGTVFGGSCWFLNSLLFSASPCLHFKGTPRGKKKMYPVLQAKHCGRGGEEEIRLLLSFQNFVAELLVVCEELVAKSVQIKRLLQSTVVLLLKF